MTPLRKRRVKLLREERRISVGKALKLLGSDYIPWYCDACDYDVPGAPCECFDIQAYEERLLEHLLN